MYINDVNYEIGDRIRLRTHREIPELSRSNAYILPSGSEITIDSISRYNGPNHDYARIGFIMNETQCTITIPIIPGNNYIEKIESDQYHVGDHVRIIGDIEGHHSRNGQIGQIVGITHGRPNHQFDVQVDLGSNGIGAFMFSEIEPAQAESNQSETNPNGYPQFFTSIHTNNFPTDTGDRIRSTRLTMIYEIDDSDNLGAQVNIGQSNGPFEITQIKLISDGAIQINLIDDYDQEYAIYKTNISFDPRTQNVLFNEFPFYNVQPEPFTPPKGYVYPESGDQVTIIKQGALHGKKGQILNQWVDGRAYPIPVRIDGGKIHHFSMGEIQIGDLPNAEDFGYKIGQTVIIDSPLLSQFGIRNKSDNKAIITKVRKGGQGIEVQSVSHGDLSIPLWYLRFVKIYTPPKTVMTSDDLEELPDDPTDQDVRFKKLDLDESANKKALDEMLVHNLILNESRALTVQLYKLANDLSEWLMKAPEAEIREYAIQGPHNIEYNGLLAGYSMELSLKHLLKDKANIDCKFSSVPIKFDLLVDPRIIQTQGMVHYRGDDDISMLVQTSMPQVNIHDSRTILRNPWKIAGYVMQYPNNKSSFVHEMVHFIDFKDISYSDFKNIRSAYYELDPNDPEAMNKKTKLSMNDRHEIRAYLYQTIVDYYRTQDWQAYRNGLINALKSNDKEKAKQSTLSQIQIIINQMKYVEYKYELADQNSKEYLNELIYSFFQEFINELKEKLNPKAIESTPEPVKQPVPNIPTDQESRFSKLELDESLLNEGRYDQLVTSLSRDIINTIKRGYTEFYLPYYLPRIVKQTGEEKTFIKGDVVINVIRISEPQTYVTDGAQLENGDIELEIGLGRQGIDNEFVAELKEVLRHEFEHAKQTAKRMPSDQASDQMTTVEYLTNNLEVPAYIQGLYKRAKTSKQSLKTVLDKFINHYRANIIEEVGLERSKQTIWQVKQLYYQEAKKLFPHLFK